MVQILEMVIEFVKKRFMSNRQLEEIQEEIFLKKLARIIGISYELLGELDWYFDTDESNDGLIYSQLMVFSDSSPRYILNQIDGLDDNNTLYLDPCVFDEPVEELY